MPPASWAWTQLTAATLDAYVPAGGRMGRWNIAGRTVEANLAKNPVGFDRQIQSIKTAGGRLCAFFLNDNDADGHDVSWIYDVDFERIADTPGLVAFVGGTRAHDMQVRLKYAGIDAAIISNIEQAIGAVADEAADDTLLRRHQLHGLSRRWSKELDELKGTDASSVPSHAATRADGSAVPTDIAPVELSRPLRIVYLYPDALNLYGDGGNVIALERRCAWRGIPCAWTRSVWVSRSDLTDADIVMMGGGSDRDQLAVAHELLAQKDKVAAYVEDGGTLLAICGSYQLLGRSYYMGDDRIEGWASLPPKPCAAPTA